MHYLSSPEIVKHCYNLEDYPNTLFFISYVPCNVLFLRGKKECGVTFFTKICTNFVEDWYENIGAEYKPSADIKPNPYGMVSIIAVPHMEDIIEIYVYEAHPLAENANLWKKIQKGDKKVIQMLMEPDHIRKLLRNSEDLPRTFKPKVIGDAEALSEIYREFKPLELNVLCSYRDIRKSEMCIDYAFRCWSTEFSRAIDLLKRGNFDGNIMECVERVVRSCEQIEIKTHLINEELPKVVEKFNDVVIPAVYDDKNARYISEGIYASLKEKAPLFSRRNESHEIAKFESWLKQGYEINRMHIYPLTTALIDYCYSEVSLDITTFGLKEKMEDHKDSMEKTFKKRKSWFEVNEIEIKTDITEIENEYNELRKKHSQQLRPFRVGIREERIDWNTCDDGSGEIW